MTNSDAVKALFEAGWCVIPVRADGSKAPAVEWRRFTASGGAQPRPEAEQVLAWASGGVGVVCGVASGNLEMIELERRAVDAGKLREIGKLAGDNGLGDLWKRVAEGYVERSPSGGVHFHIHVAGAVRPNTVLARTGSGEVLVETRGEGGFTITAPTGGSAHPSGEPWQAIIGSPADAPTLSQDEYDVLHLLLSMLDEYAPTDAPAVPFSQPTVTGPHGTADEIRPGDAFNERHTWEELLTERGWTRVRQIGVETCWRRPGKGPNSGISATTGRGGFDNLWNFSTNADLPVGQPVSKFAAYAIWNHGGDLRAAAKELASKGYGTPRRPLELVHSAEQPEQASSPPVGTPSLSEAVRRVVLTRASQIAPRPVKWLWASRMPLGALTLLGGREGIGKSTVAYALVADITRGTLAGVYSGTPKAIVVAATEDSWEHTIVPRLMAHGADLDLVHRVEVQTAEGHLAGLILPADLDELRRVVAEHDAALILLDPLMSRLAAGLDSHKDAEVRLALEPLVALADRTGASILGLIHVNKGGATDPLSTLMGSRAFAAVARAVLFVMVDPDDESQRLFGQAKNNLGRLDMPTLLFGIGEVVVAQTDEGLVSTGQIQWRGESDRSISEAMESARESGETRSQTTDAGEFIAEYLRSVGGTADSKEIIRLGADAGYSERTLYRARVKQKVVAQSSGGYPRRTYWRLPTPTTHTGSSDSSGSSGSSGSTGNGDPTRPVLPLLPKLTPPREVGSTEESRNGNGTLDWRSNRSGPPAPCVYCGRSTPSRDEIGRPAHKVCAEEASS